MLDPECLVQVNRLWYQVCVERVQIVVKERSKVLREVVGLLEARAEAVSEGRDVWHVQVFADLGLFADMRLKFRVVVAPEEPLEDGLLNLLVVLLLEEVVVEKLHGGEHEELAALGADIEGANGTICRETDWSTRHNGHRWFVHIQGRSVRIDELESAILVALDELVLIDGVALGIFALLGVAGLGLALSDAD